MLPFLCSALPIAACVSSLFIGVKAANWVADDANGEFLAPLAEYLLGKKDEAPARSRAATEEGRRRRMPWEGRNNLFLFQFVYFRCACIYVYLRFTGSVCSKNGIIFSCTELFLLVYCSRHMNNQQPQRIVCGDYFNKQLY